MRWPRGHAERASIPDCLTITAETADGEIMGVCHKTLPIYGVQFHPESVLTEHGHQMLANWLTICGDKNAKTKAVGLSPVVSISS